MMNTRWLTVLFILIFLGLYAPTMRPTEAHAPPSSLRSEAVGGRILQVGPGREYTVPSQAALVAQDGDTIEIDAGVYSNDWATWNANNLTIRGVGGRAHLQSSDLIPNGKAIWVVAGNNTRIEHIEFSGAQVVDENGAGIRQEGAGLLLNDCYFHDNKMGILAGNNSDSDIVIEYSEFANNGRGDGYSHNIYINHVRTFTLRYSYSHHASVGHTVKSRAFTNFILYNRIMDEATGASSYAVDLPNGGTSYLIGNLVQQGPNSDNSGIVSYGAEGAINPDQHLYVVNNTIVNDKPDSGTFIRVVGDVPALVQNNIFVGDGTPYNGPGQGNLVTNLITDNAGLMNREAFDYRLVEGSPAIDAGADPGSVNGVSLVPIAEYVHPYNGQERLSLGSLDIGAYEYVPPATEPPSAPSELVAIADSYNRITLTWVDTATNETSFTIERRIRKDDFVAISTVGTDVQTFVDIEGLMPSTTYTYRVRANNAAGNSDYSNHRTATTLEAYFLFLPVVMR